MSITYTAKVVGANDKVRIMEMAFGGTDHMPIEDAARFIEEHNMFPGAKSVELMDPRESKIAINELITDMRKRRDLAKGIQTRPYVAPLTTPAPTIVRDDGVQPEPVEVSPASRYHNNVLLRRPGGPQAIEPVPEQMATEEEVVEEEPAAPATVRPRRGKTSA